MSSHHIVRDQQEPALIIANGEPCSLELLGQLLEWSPYVLALDGAYVRLNQWGIKIDALLGDFDSIGSGLDLNLQDHTTVVSAPNQDKTDLEKGIEYLIAQGHRAVNVLWATGRRADHTFANITNIVRYSQQIDINILDDYSRIYMLPRHFEKWFAKDTNISLVPIGRVEGIVTQNLKYPLHNETLEIGKRIGTSNAVLADGLVAIDYASGFLMMMECWD